MAQPLSPQGRPLPLHRLMVKPELGRAKKPMSRGADAIVHGRPTQTREGGARAALSDWTGGLASQTKPKPALPVQPGTVFGKSSGYDGSIATETEHLRRVPSRTLQHPHASCANRKSQGPRPHCVSSGSYSEGVSSLMKNKYQKEWAAQQMARDAERYGR